MTQNNRIWVLMSRRLSGEASSSEVDELQRLLEESPDKQYLFGVLHAYFSDIPVASVPSSARDADLEIKFRRILDSSAAGGKAEAARGYFFLRFGKYAAVAAVLFFFIWGIDRIVSGRYNPMGRPQRNEEVMARAGARTRLLLPDGTHVWLNSNSKLHYNREFNSKNREVGLEGEAYFEVTKNAPYPFIVHAATLDIRALGTSFTVKSYPQDSTIEATLLKGAIEVSPKGSPGTAQVILKPNEKLVFNKLVGEDAKRILPAREDRHRAPAGMAVAAIRMDLPDSEKVETAWMYNRLVFDGDNFRQLAAELERWYDVTIFLRDEQLSQYRFSGVFTTESIEEALKDLQLTADFTYKINGKEIELYAKK